MAEPLTVLPEPGRRRWFAPSGDDAGTTPARSRGGRQSGQWQCRPASSAMHGQPHHGGGSDDNHRGGHLGATSSSRRARRGGPASGTRCTGGPAVTETRRRVSSWRTTGRASEMTDQPQVADQGVPPGRRGRRRADTCTAPSSPTRSRKLVRFRFGPPRPSRTGYRDCPDRVSEHHSCIASSVNNAVARTMQLAAIGAAAGRSAYAPDQYTEAGR